MKKTNYFVIATAILFPLIIFGCGDKITNELKAYSVPSAPQTVQAVAADGQVTITWSPAANATSYNIYWKISPGVASTDSAMVNASSPCVHTGLANGSAYYYAVTAVNIEGESPLSSEVTATPVSAAPASPAPANVKLTPADGRITVNWDAVSGADQYAIYWATVPGVDTTGNRILTGQSFHEHTGLSTTTTYYYRISAINSAGEGPLSSEVSARAKGPFSAMVQKLPASDAQVGDMFGISVSMDGDYAIVGAMGKDSGAMPDVGAAYILHKTGPDAWNSMTKVMSTDPFNLDNFGNSVSISGDYAIVGAMNDIGVGYDSGAAYIFHRTGPNTWDGGIRIEAPDTQADDHFGYSVAISGDYAIVGAYREAGGPGDPRQNSGAVYIFHRTGTNAWDGGTKIMAPDAGAGEMFGFSVSIDGDYAIVGSVYNNAGAAYIFHRTDANTWDAGTKITAPDAQGSDLFGYAVSIDGDYVIVGAAYEDGRDSLFPDAGAAYIFHRTGLNSWDGGTKISAPDAAAGDYFGISVAISGDAAVVGAYYEDGGSGNPLTNAGAAYVFRRTGTNAWDNGMKITAPDAQANDNFGIAVSISGYDAIVGAYLEDGGSGNPLSDTGAVYLY